MKAKLVELDGDLYVVIESDDGSKLLTLPLDEWQSMVNEVALQLQ